MESRILGIDIGGTRTKFGILSMDGAFLHEGSISTRGHASFDTFLEDLYKEISGHLKKSEEVVGIGIGAPKGNQRNGCIEEAFNLIAWGDKIPVVEKFEERFEAPTFLLNDANAAAYGEKYYGEAQPYNDFLFITLGTGLGCGVFVNGKLMVGRNAAAGELGHITIDSDGRYCNCGRQGCLETYVSAEGLMETMRKFMDWQDGLSIEEKYPDAKSITVAARDNDPFALKAYDYTGKVFGEALANIAAIFDPEAIILGGGVANAGDVLLIPMLKYFQEATLGAYLNDIEFKISDPTQLNMGVLGAASYAKEMISENPEVFSVEV